MKYAKESEILKALGHPIRLQMIDGLLKHECNVTEIVKNLGLPQSTVSQHLAILRNRGIIAPHKQGVTTCYEVVDQRVKRLVKLFSEESV